MSGLRVRSLVAVILAAAAVTLVADDKETNQKQKKAANGNATKAKPRPSITVTVSEINPDGTGEVTIVGRNTNFEKGKTKALFNSGISVGDGKPNNWTNVNVLSATQATASLRIPPSARGLKAAVSVQTGKETFNAECKIPPADAGITPPSVPENQEPPTDQPNDASTGARTQPADANDRPTPTPTPVILFALPTPSEGEPSYAPLVWVAAVTLVVLAIGLQFFSWLELRKSNTTGNFQEIEGLKFYIETRRLPSPQPPQPVPAFSMANANPQASLDDRKKIPFKGYRPASEEPSFWANPPVAAQENPQPARVWEQSPPPSSPPPPQQVVSADAQLLDDYEAVRSNRDRFHEEKNRFTARYDVTAISCINPDDRQFNPNAELRFEKASRGAFLLIRDGGRNLCLPSFDTDFLQARERLREIIEYPLAEASAFRLVRCAELTQNGSEWVLTAPGRMQADG